MVKELQKNEKFLSVESLEHNLRDAFGSTIAANNPDKQMCFGYILPGHGVKGKQREILNTQHISEMYATYEGKKVPVTLWLKCRTQSRKKRERLSPPSDEQIPAAKRAGPGYSSHMKKMLQVDDIMGKLKEKHEGKYTPEQLRAWAHLIQMSKHESYEAPPDKPFFGKRKMGSKTATPASAVGISPSKRIDLRSKCIDQLDKWHALMERGAISSNEYKDLQATILSDIKKF